MFLVVQNDPQCPAGGLAGLLTCSGHPFRTVAAYGGEAFPELSAVTGVIVLGGEMGVNDDAAFPHLGRVRAFMSQTLDAGTPLLGICLGGQLLAQVAGGAVASPSSYGEQGVCEVTLNEQGIADPLFAGVANPFVTFQLHNDSFSVPAGATLLASSSACPTQAFRLGRHAYGLQFHPEVDQSIVSAWGALSTPPKDFLSSFQASQLLFDSASRSILANFISLAVAAHPLDI
jgi:GMP synthase-like glutamine amidotransferase